MNLLYISNNSNAVDGGLNWSVPASVKAQQKYDNVLWVDLTPSAFQKHWGEVEAYHNLKDFGTEISLSILPAPFNHPDCVIFESFYYIQHVHFAKELKRNNIPYIIIPRGSLTADAFHNGGTIKYIKKKLAHALFFNSYIKDSKAVQYLTEMESFESHKNFNASSFILPNGFVTPSIWKTSFSDGIRSVYIGRQDIYQKGLDMLFEAIHELHDELKAAGFFLDVYGPPRYDVKRVTEMIHELQIDDLVFNHEHGVSGNEKQEALLKADVFFLTSRFEGHPMSLIEALAYGLPSFITKGANMYDEIDQSKSGWACEISKDSIKDSLLKMIAEKQKFKEYSSNAITLAAQYDWDVLAKQFHDILIKLIK